MRSSAYFVSGRRTVFMYDVLNKQQSDYASQEQQTSMAWDFIRKTMIYKQKKWLGDGVILWHTFVKFHTYLGIIALFINSHPIQLYITLQFCVCMIAPPECVFTQNSVFDTI